VLAVLTYPRLHRIDDAADVPQRELALLASLPLFSPLPVTTLERLACRLQHVAAAAGTRLVGEGDEGDFFYVVASGEIEVSKGGRHLATLGPGEYFGEIALLHDAPRSATCVAATDCELYTLERERFVSAVSGHALSAAEAESVASRRLADVASLDPAAPTA
jgi:CRP-like cAMP-binding protein